nr:ribonuclease H-like domain-containing protein [Tanacetum cinerariifolium]
MAFTSLSSSSSDTEVAPCTKACSKSYAFVQSHYDKLIVDFRMSQFDVHSYKTSLESIEARLVVYQQNEHVFEEDIKLLKLDVMLRDNALVELRKKFKKDEKERDENFIPPKPHLVFHDASTISETVPNVFNVEPSTTKPTKEMSLSNRPSAPIIEDYVSNSKDKSKVEHTTQAANLRKDIPKSRSHKHSWTRKACFVCKSLNHLIKDFDYYEKKMVQNPVWNHAMRVNYQNSARMTHPHSKKHVVPTTVLTRSRLVQLNAVRPFTTVVPQTNMKHQRPATHVSNKPHSPIRRPINHIPVHKISNFHQKVTTVKITKVNVVKGTKRNWGNPQQALNDKGVIESGCSRHITGNISYLSDFIEINGGYVAFGGNPEGGKIIRKGKIRTGKLDFDDVYFVKELKFNLFSVSQMCDKKNNVLFIETEYVVLSSDFKFPDENHFLLRVPIENNMYNVELKNVVPS